MPRPRQIRLPVALLGLLTLAGMAGADAGAQTPAATAAPAAPQATVLTREAFDALLAAPERLLVLDVRRPDEIAAIGGFPAYLNIQIGELGERLAYVPRDRTIVTVSNHAHRAQQAAALLTARGYTVAGAVGAQDYQAQGGTLARPKPPAPAPTPQPGAPR